MIITDYRYSLARRIVRARHHANLASKRGNGPLFRKRSEVARRHEQALGMLIASEVVRQHELEGKQ